MVFFIIRLFPPIFFLIKIFLCEYVIFEKYFTPTQLTTTTTLPTTPPPTTTPPTTPPPPTTNLPRDVFNFNLKSFFDKEIYLSSKVANVFKIIF